MSETTVSSTSPEGHDALLKVGNLTVNFYNFQVAVDGFPVFLTFQEFELLRLLVANPDRVVSNDELTSSLWHATGRTLVRRLNVVVHRLRAKLASSSPYQIDSVRGRGYGFIAANR